MNIDIYIQLFKDHCNNLDHEEMDGIAEWLEELKAFKESAVFYSNRPIEDIVLEARADAIDECIELIEHGCFISGTAGNCLRRHMEQLKEKKE